MTLEQAIGIFNANYKKEWRESTNPKRQQAVNSLWNQYVDQLVYTDVSVDEITANKWYNNYYTFVNQS